MPRCICPHCHTPLDGRSLDPVSTAATPALACPECDGLIPLPHATETASADEAVGQRETHPA